MSGYSDTVRREMAERIRYAAVEGTDNPMGTLKHLLGMGAGDTYRHVFCKVADLMEPRSCSVRLEPGTAAGVCSECLARVEAVAAVYDANGGLPPRYCANCGAKITELERAVSDEQGHRER